MGSLHQYNLEGHPCMRNWKEVMTPRRLSSIQPSPFSATRLLINKLLSEKWKITLDRFDLSNDQRGTAVYSIKAPGKLFSFIAFSFPPKKEGRTGRIISRVWDMMCALEEGPAPKMLIEQARSEMPKLYKGRANRSTLIWGRANRSSRAFEATVDALCRGVQPKISDLNSVCYLMRNTGVDGNGTFGTRSFHSLGSNHPLGGVLESDLLTAYMMREFSCDFVERLAKERSSRAITLRPELRRYIGVGNGSGLGLIFFVHRHPKLINSWIEIREKAIATMLGLELGQGDLRINRLISLLNRVVVFRKEDVMVYESFTSSKVISDQLKNIIPLLQELRDEGTLRGKVRRFPLDYIAKYLCDFASDESYETFLSLGLELVKGDNKLNARNIVTSNELEVQPTEILGELQKNIETAYEWALNADLKSEMDNSYVWYKSRSAEEPRRGLRSEIPTAFDLGINFSDDLRALVSDISKESKSMKVSRFLLNYPEHRFAVARLQTLEGRYFHTPHVNCNSENFAPVDFLRMVNVGFHGLDKTRDFLQRNLRGVLYHGAPSRHDINKGLGEDWFYPKQPT